jgi:hypothetical protein
MSQGSVTMNFKTEETIPNYFKWVNEGGWQDFFIVDDMVFTIFPSSNKQETSRIPLWEKLRPLVGPGRSIPMGEFQKLAILI